MALIKKEPNATKTRKGQTAYLFGNGINRVDGDKEDRYEWGNLLGDINKKYANSSIRNIREKPFPMVYDEIISYAASHGSIEEGEVKRFIRNKIEQLQANHRYQNLKELDCKHIITTNYDYLLEKNLSLNWTRQPISRVEYSYSIHRYQEANSTRVWHAHGEQADIRSILLGFRHYINYSSKVKERAELFLYDLKNQVKPRMDSWVDLFFTHNVKIVGLGMSFTEYPLWWLLAYRQYKQNTDRTIDINNAVELVVPSFNMDANKQNLTDMLKAYQIGLVELDADDYDDFYEKVLTNQVQYS